MIYFRATSFGTRHRYDLILNVQWVRPAAELAELRELLYTAQEPDFFELMRGLFALPEHTRSALLDFLSNPDTRPVQATNDADGRCTLRRGKPEHHGKPTLTIVE